VESKLLDTHIVACVLLLSSMAMVRVRVVPCIDNHDNDREEMKFR
jgi:hypothetical protein